MSKSVAPFGNKILASRIFDDSRLSSEAHSEDEYDTPMKEHERDTFKRQRDASDEGGKSPKVKKSRGTKFVKSRSICKSSPGEKSKTQSKMFKSFQNGESSEEEEPQNFSFGNTPKKSNGKKSYGQTTKTSSTKNPLDNWLKKSSIKEVRDNFNCDSENIDANKSRDTSKISNQCIKSETKNVQNSSLEKKSSVFSDVANAVENYHANSSDEDIKAVDEMSLEPLDNSSADITTEKKNYLQNYKIPRLNKNDVSKNKGELHFDRQLKNRERKGLHDSSSEKPVVISILKNGSNNSTGSVKILSNKNVEELGENEEVSENGFKFPERLKQSKSKSSGKKSKTGSEVFDDNTGETEEGGSKPRKETVKKKRSVKGKGKESNRASSVFDDSDDNEVAKKYESGSSVFEEDNDAKVQKTGSSMFDYDDPPDVLKLIDRDTGFKKHARRRQSMAKMAKRSNCSMVKRVRSESTESEEEPTKKPVKRKPRKKKEDADEKDKKKQKNINQYFQTSSVMKATKYNHSPTKKGSDEDSDEELSDSYVPDLDELLKMPERPADGAKTKDEILDEMDKQIADRQKAHEQEMDKLDKDIEAEKRKRIEKKARMKENAKRRNLLETQLTERKLRKMFNENLDYLQDIWDGKVESSRHKAFHQSIRTRHALYYTMITDPFTDEQLDWTLDEIGKVWMNTKEEHREHNEYVWKVILAECFIKFYMDFFSVTKEDAVQMISETPLHKKDQLKDMKVSDESENSESSEDV